MREYAKAPRRERVLSHLDTLFAEDHEDIASLNLAALRVACGYLGLETHIVATSSRYQNEDLHGQERIVDICRTEGATTYVNSLAGRTLYDAEHFAPIGAQLRFLEPQLAEYQQRYDAPFIPGLSVLDMMMYVTPQQAAQLVPTYRLLTENEARLRAIRGE